MLFTIAYSFHERTKQLSFFERKLFFNLEGIVILFLFQRKKQLSFGKQQ